MARDTLPDLFVNELEVAYDAERCVEQALDEFSAHVADEDARQALEAHRERTREHVDRLERVFEVLGLSPETAECAAVQGIVDEHRRFAERDPAQAERDLFDVVTAQKIAQYEIATYNNLANVADELDLDEAGHLIHRTLAEEEAALTRLIEIADGYDYGTLDA